METYIAILRGINVSGHKMIKMADLKISLSELGFTHIQTYIQSGNLVFSHKKSDQRILAQQIEDKILKGFGFDVPVIVRKLDEFKKVAENNAFVNERNEEVSYLHVTFLAEKPEKDSVDKLAGINYPPDEFIIAGDVVYLFCPNGYGNTKLSNTFFEKKLKTPATTRNWKTVNKLIEIASVV